MAQQARAKIRGEVKNRHLAALLDIVTLNNRSILGLSVQFRSNETLIVRSIGMLELVESHTAKYLGEVMNKCLNEFEIGLRQIVSISKDNGANVSKMVRDIDDCVKGALHENHEQLKITQVVEEIDASDEDNTDHDIAQLLNESDDVTDEQHLMNLFEDVLLDSHKNTLNQVSKEIENYGYNIKWDISEVNCAVHTLQLGTCDSLKSLPMHQQNVIQLCRKLVKFVRLPKSMQEINAAKIKYIRPRLETTTRWGSMYLMVNKKIHLNMFIRFKVNCILFVSAE